MYTCPVILTLKFSGNKNIFAATGSNASLEYITTKGSAGVEVLRNLAHSMASYFGVSDFHRRHAEVSAAGDIKALLADLQMQRVHEFTSGRHVPPPPTRTRKKRRNTVTSGVRDILLLGLQGLTHKHLFEYWSKRSSKGGTGLYEGDGEWNAGGEEGIDDEDGDDIGEEAPTGGTAFDDAHGQLNVDLDEEVEFDLMVADDELGENEDIFDESSELPMYAPLPLEI